MSNRLDLLKNIYGSFTGLNRKRWDLDTYALARTIVDALEEKKGEDIVLLDIREIAIFADYFVICSGTSDRMLHALADGAEERVLEQFKVRARVEGSPNDWAVIIPKASPAGTSWS